MNPRIPSVPPRARLPVLLGLHLLATAAAADLFVRVFGHSPRTVPAHVLVLAEWDLALLTAAIAIAVLSRGVWTWPRAAYRWLLVATGTLQVYLYTLNGVSNVAWGRNITGHIVAAFAPTVLSGREPFPIGPLGISAFVCGTVALLGVTLGCCRRWIDGSLDPWLPGFTSTSGGWMHALGSTASVVVAAGLFYATASLSVEARDNLFWKEELFASFFRPQSYAFEPTARREAVADRDAILRASYPHHVAGARRTHVILIIVDSLRADRMQVYGYQRPTTPFLSRMVAEGQMKRVDAAFSSCSESFCGITSTLASREFRDISARTFQLQDVLSDQGYQTWFLLSGNHRAWNGLPSFYHARSEAIFDGTSTARYTMDDDRLVLEGLERVPEASAEHPAFFYIHLMSTHYLGVQLPESHVFTSADDQVAPGLEPYKILEKLNKPDRYDDRVRQADGMIRRLFDALRAKHYLDDAMVVVTGDHGEGLGERHWAHGWNLYDEDIRIPMLFYDAPAASYPDLTFAAQVDIAPTIVDRLRLPIPASWEGQSLLEPSHRRFTYHQTYFLPNRFAVLYRDDRALFKYIATPQYGTEELYDLRTDRREEHNLATIDPQLTALLRDKVRTYRSDQP